MATKDLERAARGVEMFLREIETRIRRYTMDRKLSDGNLERLKELHKEWRVVRKDFYAAVDKATGAELREIEERALVIDREIDLVQRELISQKSFKAGTWTVAALAVVLLGLVVLYLWSHGVRSLRFEEFEPLAEWGPLKYLEVAFWSEFGVLCYLLFLAANYMSRRDFDEWYQTWYLATALRAPLITIVLMVMILEFTEWYAEDSEWIDGLMEDGNKFYFIAFMSFLLGLASDRVAGITRELSESVADFAEAVAKKFGSKLKDIVTPEARVGD